jgi:hypothetical protein
MDTPTTDLAELEERVYAAEDRLYCLPDNASPRVRQSLQDELDALTAEWTEANQRQRRILADIEHATNQILTPAA